MRLRDQEIAMRNTQKGEAIRPPLINMSTRFGVGRRRRGWATWLAALVACLPVTGCGSRRTPPPVDTTASAPSTPTASAERATEDGAAADVSPQSDHPITPAPSSIAGADEPGPNAGQLEAVGPEDARRGSSIRGGGIITEPLRQYFLTQHRIIFLNLQHAEQLYKGTHGRMPSSHEEYMREIIEFNEIQLPELDPGWDYYYDATDEQLKKRRTS